MRFPRFRFPFFSPHVHTGIGYGISDVGRACVNRTFGCITTIIIIVVLIYLFSKNPAWFQNLVENIKNFFSSNK
ncbi:hypothetical protein ES702_00897 [subsurface metagenome]